MFTIDVLALQFFMFLPSKLKEKITHSTVLVEEADSDEDVTVNANGIRVGEYQPKKKLKALIDPCL